MPKKLIKSAFQKTNYTEQQLLELKRCAEDPIYMMETFMRVLHPVKGEVPFKLFDYQKRMITAYEGHRQVVSLTGRQLGKSDTYNTIIKKDNCHIKIGKLIPQTLKMMIVSFLENILVDLMK